MLMFTRRQRFSLGLVACSIVATLAGCQAASDSSVLRDASFPGEPLTDEQVFALGLVDEMWGGADLGLDIGEWTALGPVEWLPESDIAADHAAAVAQADLVPSSDEPGEFALSGEFLVIDVPSSQIYHVRMDPAHMLILGEALSEYEDDEDGPNLDEPSAEASQAFPNGLTAKPDIMAASTRSLLPDNTYKQAPWNSMGVSTCTGTMIGARTLVTAGHCVVGYGAGNHQVYYTGGNGWTIAINNGQASVADRCFVQTGVSKMFVPAQLCNPDRIRTTITATTTRSLLWPIPRIL
jgi:hypothetical protein